MRSRAKKWSVPAALALSACAAPGVCNYDAGRTYGPPTSAACPHADTIDAQGVRCTCIGCTGDGGPTCDSGYVECCDHDVGNPCPICALSARESDGSRRYDFYPNGTCEPACFT